MEKKWRGFWIDIEHDGYDDFFGCVLLEHPRQGPLKWQESLIHVVEKAALDAAEARIAELEEQNKILADGSKELLESKSDVYAKLLRRTKELESMLAKAVWGLEMLDSGFAGMFGYPGKPYAEDAVERGPEIVTAALTEIRRLQSLTGGQDQGGEGEV